MGNGTQTIAVMLGKKRGPGRPPNPDVQDRERRKREYRERQEAARKAWKESQAQLRERELEQGAEAIAELRAIRHTLEVLAVAVTGSTVASAVQLSASRSRR